MAPKANSVSKKRKADVAAGHVVLNMNGRAPRKMLATSKAKCPTPGQKAQNADTSDVDLKADIDEDDDDTPLDQIVARDGIVPSVNKPADDVTVIANESGGNSDSKKDSSSSPNTFVKLVTACELFHIRGCDYCKYTLHFVRRAWAFALGIRLY